ncbi:hypothetical protein D3C86_1750420 [compost metagenome]
MSQVVDDFVGCLGQQQLEVFPCFVQLTALDLGNCQAVARHVVFRVFVELGAEALGTEPRGFFIDQLDARADQLIAHAVFDATLWR